MLLRRKAFLALVVTLLFPSACAPATPFVSDTNTPPPSITESASITETSAPAESSLEVEKEALRGVQVDVWHPWFGAEASLFQSQVAQFNTENEWGIIVSGQSQGNYSELFLQTAAAAVEGSSYPQIVVGLPEYALEWQEHIVDLTPYVSDPVYGLSTADVSDFPEVIWKQDEVDGKRFGVPAQRTTRFLLYNESWARELGFVSPPETPTEFEEQVCAAHEAVGTDENPDNDPLGGWLIDTHAITPLSWMIAFGGGVQEAEGYRFLTPGNIAAFRFVKTLQQKNCAWVASPDLSVPDRFAARQALFVTASLEDLPEQARAFSAANNTDEWTVLKFPGEERDALVVYGSSFLMFESDDTTQLASWLFLRWLLSPENQARWVQSTGLFPLRNSTMQLLSEYVASHPQWAEAVELLSEAETTPQLASWRLVRVMLEDGFRDMFDTIRHPDLTDGQVPLILKQMDDTAQDLNN
ncbi:MAG TPA: extracellular solute-binding protein [Anaerolineales bacterium]|jgi:ABC-type glycerol-3-phosphate transport system substrate-binding protein|nr:extracellular solute-binding protein [Anaerolineales bacterium]